jgi:ABC-type antimicrobial peptide transport system permease subunit
VTAFLRGLDAMLAISGDPRVVLVHAVGMSDNLELSSVAARTPGLLTASLSVVDNVAGQRCASPEIYLGTLVETESSRGPSMGVVRGVTRSAPLVRASLQVVEGHWPGPGEAMVGMLAGAKLGAAERDLAVGKSIRFEGRSWRISGRFAATGGALEAEIWLPLEELQQATKRQDLTMVALRLANDADSADVDLFCKERVDLELQATRETDYYGSLAAHYRPIRALAWVMTLMIAGAGAFATLNMMYGAVAGRTREVATLQTIGFGRRAIAVSILQEATTLSAAGALAALALALVALDGFAVRFSMGAFVLRMDPFAVVLSLALGMALGLVGAMLPATRALARPIVDGLRAVA